jgi:hypothetical protein
MGGSSIRPPNATDLTLCFKWGYLEATKFRLTF